MGKFIFLGIITLGDHMKWTAFSNLIQDDDKISKIIANENGEDLILLKLPVSKTVLLINLDPHNMCFSSNNPKIAQTDHTLVSLLNYYIDEVVDEKNKLDEKISHHKEKIDGAVSKTELESLLAIDQACHYLDESLDNLSKIIAYLNRKSKYLKDYEYLNLTIKIDQLNFNIDTIQAQVNTLTEISDLIYSQKQNNYVKRLTILALLFSIPTFITSFYGMNVNLPFQSHPFLLGILLLINFILTIIALIVIKKIES